jgi:hypothetical protein
MNEKQFQVIVDFLAKNQSGWPEEVGPFQIAHDTLIELDPQDDEDRLQCILISAGAAESTALVMVELAMQGRLSIDEETDMWAFAGISFGLELAARLSLVDAGPEFPDIEIAG